MKSSTCARRSADTRTPAAASTPSPSARRTPGSAAASPPAAPKTRQVAVDLFTRASSAAPATPHHQPCEASDRAQAARPPHGSAPSEQGTARPAPDTNATRASGCSRDPHLRQALQPFRQHSRVPPISPDADRPQHAGRRRPTDRLGMHREKLCELAQSCSAARPSRYQFTPKSLSPSAGSNSSQVTVIRIL